MIILLQVTVEKTEELRELLWATHLAGGRSVGSPGGFPWRVHLSQDSLACGFCPAMAGLLPVYLGSPHL